MQVKGRVAFASPLARFSTTTPSKAGRMQNRVEEENAAHSGRITRNQVAWQENSRRISRKRGFSGVAWAERGRKKEDAMGANEDKTKFSIRVDTQLLELADSCIGSGAARNRTELIEDALRFYMGYLMAGKAEDYLLQSLSSAVSGTLQDSENRLARMDFKIAVELSKLSHVIAYTHDVDGEALQRLHAKCVEEVKRINGAIEFEDAYRYQRREA